MTDQTISDTKDLPTQRRRHLRGPLRQRRMLRGRVPVDRAERISLRVDVPERLLRMTRFGLDFASEASGWWRRVEDEMQALVDRHLPPRASEVEMRLDVDRLEVVLSYVPARGAAPRVHCA